MGPLLVTIFIAASWVGATVMGRVPNPLVTLTIVGAVYGVLAVLLQQIMWNLILNGPPEEAPASVPILITSWISIIATNTIWGAFLGLLAVGMRRLLPRRASEKTPPSRTLEEEGKKKVRGCCTPSLLTRLTVLPVRRAYSPQEVPQPLL